MPVDDADDAGAVGHDRTNYRDGALFAVVAKAGCLCSMGGTLSKKEKALLGLFHRLPGSQGFVARPVASSLDIIAHATTAGYRQARHAAFGTRCSVSV